MKYFLLLVCCSVVLTGCFGKKSDATQNANGATNQRIEFDTNDNLDQALQDLEAVKE